MDQLPWENRKLDSSAQLNRMELQVNRIRRQLDALEDLIKTKFAKTPKERSQVVMDRIVEMRRRDREEF